VVSPVEVKLQCRSTGKRYSGSTTRTAPADTAACANGRAISAYTSAAARGGAARRHADGASWVATVSRTPTTGVAAAAANARAPGPSSPSASPSASSSASSLAGSGSPTALSTTPSRGPAPDSGALPMRTRSQSASPTRTGALTSGVSVKVCAAGARSRSTPNCPSRLTRQARYLTGTSAPAASRPGTGRRLAITTARKPSSSPIISSVSWMSTSRACARSGTSRRVGNTASTVERRTRR
jgi:hypothetical protein